MGQVLTAPDPSMYALLRLLSGGKDSRVVVSMSLPDKVAVRAPNPSGM